MSLQQYREKRSFRDTPEPRSGKSKDKALHFVVQKHDASRLHYDFRLEMDGVLKSWAVPKGPSLDPKDKRLAMMVEDHPYDYKDFEGIIPEGNYGAGTVIVWDEGTYEPIDGAGEKKEQEKSLLKQLKAGSLKIALKGKKLKGEFALVRTKGMAENSWLLIKHRDKYAAATDVTKKDKSVLSGKSISRMAAAPEGVYGEKKNRKTASRKTAAEKASAKKGAGKTAAKKTAVKKRSAASRTRQKKADTASGEKENPATSNLTVNSILEKAPAAPFSENLSPMLATLVDEPFDDEDWEYEIKWDGYRALGFRHKHITLLKSRNNKSFDVQFYPVHDALKSWDIDAVVDGEIVVVDKKGIAHFNALQNWRSEADGELLYYVFDLLWYKGRLLTGLPLKERMAVLKSMLPAEDDSIIRGSFSVRGEGRQFFSAAKEMGLEGMIAKKLDSRYEPGERSRNWLKIKVSRRQEAVIIGYTRNTGSPKLFSSLLLGAYSNGRLEYVGKVGTGFNAKMQQEMMKRFKSLIIKKSPLKDIPDYNKPSRFRPNPPHASATWLKPELVCEISFSEVTQDGVFRHPAFEGMRADKNARQVVREKEMPVEAVVEEDPEEKPARKAGRKKPVKDKAVKDKAGVPVIKPPVKNGRKTLLNPQDKTQVRKVSGVELKFTHLEKPFWPEEGITKRDLLNYYYQIAPYILPYLKNRPQSLNRFPDGYRGKHFYQKDVSGKIPSWIDTLPYKSQDDDRRKKFLVVTNEASLLYVANYGCVEMNPWNSTVKKPENPDWCILDLDPDVKGNFGQVIEAARVIHELLEDAGIPSYPKTSGSTGMHIYIPLHARYTYEESKEFARLIVTIVHHQIPGFTTIERQLSDRKGKMYLDFLQNRPQATLAAPYSVRPKPGATVSMPLHWDEVKKGLKMQDFTLKRVPDMLKERGDLFSGVLGKGISLSKSLKTLRSYL
ncbi:DNA ligase D [Compostibacter hankyongensis]|uniref:DNA ligase (ATP) n=1 Tax=Compostibacter hankyongensis TaxID=1007089 RepID=A0ABP8G458_9BACT